MKKNLFVPVILASFITVISSCKREDIGILNYASYADTSGTLKELANFPIGMAVEYPLASTNSRYWGTVKREANSITFGNELKNSSIVKAGGTYDFTTADNFYNLATNAGLQVYGHTLVWHSQQRADYYTSLIGGDVSGPTVTNLVVNPGFEVTANSNGDIAQGWQILNGAGQFSISSTNSNSGTNALQANVPAGGQNYNTQIITRTPIPVTAGKTYTISYFIKGAAAQNIQFEIRPSSGSVNYQGGKPVSTSYSKVSYDYLVPAGVTTIQLAFDLGGTANTLYIDDVSIVDATTVPPPSNTEIAAIVDNEMKRHIQTVVGRYAGKIKSWDVINEPFTDGGGELRNNTNSLKEDRTDIFVWQNYLGRGYAAKAFQYARAADANADLFMNDFNLESDETKLNAFVQLASELKAANAGITGVGTQMHIDAATADFGKIAMCFDRLASTGLKVRITELDIRINATKKEYFVPTEQQLRHQATVYKFVIDSYFRYVPVAQRAGITFWGVHDPDSWYNSNNAPNVFEYPLLFDKDYNKKVVYSAVKQALMDNR
ncbi:endo-1,4-beta-xylanase [Desertivirga xinjiangensis]|uniref:endo-1,4-beta-xylanase n=1 Tax=Desertivirga xinjiangensis TaxID=539206 RepID=UPI00210BC5AB|nr:endo-1,4-beta-xylanase [Pedobacter xinjiangensis]